MKKLLGFLALLAIFAPVSAFSAEIKGTVDSMDSSTGQIQILDSQTGQRHTIKVHPNIIGSLSKGSVVNVSVPEGSNTADTVAVEMN